LAEQILWLISRLTEFCGNYKIPLKMGLIIISLADKPDIQNISIPAKKLKVFLTQY